MCVPKVKQHSQTCSPLGSTCRELAGAPNTPAVRNCYGWRSGSISSVRARSPSSRLCIIHIVDVLIAMLSSRLNLCLALYCLCDSSRGRSVIIFQAPRWECKVLPKMCTPDAWSGKACPDTTHSIPPPRSVRSFSMRNKHLKS